MAQIAVNNRGAWLVTGILVGLFFGSMLPNAPLHASATHGQDNFAICTGEVDVGVEGVYFLDFLTGDLTGAVININTRKFTTAYKHNVMKDFGLDGVKSPRFLMVSGVAEIRRGPQPVGFGRSLIYVAEMTSGQFMAYAVPWSANRNTSPAAVSTGFVALDGGKFRTQTIRDTK